MEFEKDGAHAEEKSANELNRSGRRRLLIQPYPQRDQFPNRNHDVSTSDGDIRPFRPSSRQLPPRRPLRLLRSRCHSTSRLSHHQGPIRTPNPPLSVKREIINALDGGTKSHRGEENKHKKQEQLEHVRSVSPSYRPLCLHLSTLLLVQTHPTVAP